MTAQHRQMSKSALCMYGRCWYLEYKIQHILCEVAGEARGQPVIVEITIMLDMFHSGDMIMKVID